MSFPSLSTLKSISIDRRRFPGAAQIAAHDAADAADADNHAAYRRTQARNLTILLCATNLLCYVDRNVVAALLPSLIEYFDIDNLRASYMAFCFGTAIAVFGLVVGYFGDRWSRTRIISAGLVIWSSAGYAMTWLSERQFGLFLFLRVLSGAGQACCVGVSPAIIGDIFAGKQRTIALSVFYSLLPAGTGIGYIVAAHAYCDHPTTDACIDPSRSIFRHLAIFGFALALSFCFSSEPKRGRAEGPQSQFHEHVLRAIKMITKTTDIDQRHQSLKAALLCLLQNKTYVYTTIGVTSVNFITTGASFWTPLLLVYNSMTEINAEGDAALNFGAAVLGTGISGVVIGAAWSAWWRPRKPEADAVICGVGLFLVGPTLYLTLLAMTNHEAWFWGLGSLGLVCLNLNWALNADIMLAVVPPYGRAKAEAFQRFVGSALGGIPSPFLIGYLSAVLKPPEPPGLVTYLALFRGLRNAMMIMCFVAVLGGGAFLAAALHLKEDKKKVDLMTKGGKIVEDVVKLHKYHMARGKRLRSNGVSPTLQDSVLVGEFNVISV